MNQLMSRLGLIRAFCFVCAAALAVGVGGCPSPIGSACNTDCPEGFVCVTLESERDPAFTAIDIYRPTRRVCARACATGRDCAPGVNCELGVDRFEPSAGYCNEFGASPEGTPCAINPPSAALCGPGLSCGGGLCAVACSLASTDIEDRRCPSGMQCALGGYCTPLPCDPTLPRGTQCQNIPNERGDLIDMVCRRWTNPGLEDGTTCVWVEQARHCDDGTECVIGEVCASGRCYPPADAPPMTPAEVGVTLPAT